MIALTVMAAGAAASRCATSPATPTRRDSPGGLTVQIVEAGAGRARPPGRSRALAARRTCEDVAQVRRVPDAELDGLLEPWLGAAGVRRNDAIPMPALIDVRLAAAPSPTCGSRRSARALTAPAPAARVDAQASWLAPVFDAIARCNWLALGPGGAARGDQRGGGLAARRERARLEPRDDRDRRTCSGGTDGQIARIFQRSIRLDALLGGDGRPRARSDRGRCCSGVSSPRLGSGMVARRRAWPRRLGWRSARFRWSAWCWRC